MFDKDSPFRPAPSANQKSDLASDGLVDAIVGCLLPPDTIVTEADLAARFGLTLAATRAALARLAALGWMRAELRRGWRVLPVTGRHLSDLCLARRTLEPALANALPAAALAHEIEIQSKLYTSLRGLDGADTAARLLRQELRLRMLFAECLPQPRMRAWLVETWQMSVRADLHLSQSLSLRLPPVPVDLAATALVDGRQGDFLGHIAAATEAFASRCLTATAHSDGAIGDAAVIPRMSGSKSQASTTQTAGKAATKTRAKTEDRDQPTGIHHETE